MNREIDDLLYTLLFKFIADRIIGDKFLRIVDWVNFQK